MNTHTILRQSLSLLIAGFLLLAASPNRCFAQNDPLLQIRMDVVYLASDDLQGRETGTLGEALAADYIRHRMEQIGLTPKGNNGWYQSFDFSSNPHGGNIRDKQGKNVLGFLNRKAKKTLVIGAHYDHLGHGATGSLAPNDHSIHNGADDNASGIASLLWLAEQLKNTKDLDINVLFVAFSGEEFGLYGSKAFTANWTIPQESILAMFNMDMVGRLNAEKTIAINGVGTSMEWKSLLEKIKPGQMNFTYGDGGIGPSDHTSFYLKNIPSLHFFTGQHKDYHKPSDDSYLVNYEGILQVSEVILALALQLSEKPALTFQKTKDENKQQASAFKVTMGVMPDYVFNGEGMRIDAVLENRPAMKAGLEAGDIIIQIGPHPVKDVYGYMEALAKFEKGQSAEVKVKRKDQEIVKKVDF